MIRIPEINECPSIERYQRYLRQAFINCDVEWSRSSDTFTVKDEDTFAQHLSQGVPESVADARKWTSKTIWFGAEV
jgi:hypothetical protein